VIGGQNNVFLIQDPAVMQKTLGDGGDSRKKLCTRNSQELEGESREKKKSVVTSTLTSVLLLTSPSGSWASSVSSSDSTFVSSAVLSEDRRERDSHWYLDRRFVTTDRVASRLLLSLFYAYSYT
jgi:hypothetical protein